MKATIEQMIHQKGEQGEATSSVNTKIDKDKNKVPTPRLFTEDDEYYQAMRGIFPQLISPLVNLTKTEPLEVVKILANKMAKLEFT